MEPENYRLLYSDETGEVVGFDEVQLMDDLEEREQRRLPLRNLLEKGDIGEQFESLLILAAWGDEVAIKKAGDFLAGDSNPYHGVNTHRLHGADRSHDLIADALGVGSNTEGVDRATLITYAHEFLNLASSVFFQDGLATLLGKLGEGVLLEPTQQLLDEHIANGRWPEASDLLPAIAAMNKHAGWEALQQFGRGGNYVDKTIRPAIRALGRIKTPNAIEELNRIRSTADESIQRSVNAARKYGF